MLVSSFEDWEGREGRGGGGSSKGGQQAVISRSEDFIMSVEVFWLLWLSEPLNVFYLFVTLCHRAAVLMLI